MCAPRVQGGRQQGGQSNNWGREVHLGMDGVDPAPCESGGGHKGEGQGGVLWSQQGGWQRPAGRVRLKVRRVKGPRAGPRECAAPTRAKITEGKAAPHHKVCTPLAMPPHEGVLQWDGSHCCSIALEPQAHCIEHSPAAPLPACAVAATASTPQSSRMHHEGVGVDET